MRKLILIITTTFILLTGCDSVEIIKDNFTHEVKQEITREVFREGNQFYYRNEMNKVIPISINELAYYSELAEK